MPEGERKPSTPRLEAVKPLTPPLARLDHKRRRWPLIGAGIVVLLAAVGAYYLLSGGQEPVRYITAPVTRGAVARSITASGTVNPVSTIQVGT